MGICHILLPLVGLKQDRYVNLLRRANRDGEVGSDGNCRLYLLLPIIKVHISDVVPRGMGIWVLIVTPMILNLQDGCQSLRTEGYLVPSRAARDQLLVQVELISVDDLTHLLCQG